MKRYVKSSSSSTVNNLLFRVEGVVEDLFEDEDIDKDTHNYEVVAFMNEKSTGEWDGTWTVEVYTFLQPKQSSLLLYRLNDLINQYDSTAKFRKIDNSVYQAVVTL